MHVAVGVCCLCALSACNVVLGLDETGARGSGPRTVVFDNSESAIDLVDFPVLVSIEHTSDFPDVGDPTRDLRFHDPDTERDLPFDVDRWELGGSGTVWVRVPQIDARSRTDHIVMHVGPDIGAADPSAVWAEHDLVVHGTARDGALPNAAGPAYSGRSTTLATVDGIVGDAIQLPGLIEFDNSEPILDGWPQFTLELWIYVDHEAVTAPDEFGFLDRGGSVNLGRVFDYDNVDNLVRLQLDTHFANNNDAYLNTLIVLKRWFHVVYAYDGQTLWLYRNGVFEDVDRFDAPSALVAGAQTLLLGSRSTTGSMTGMIDELRVSRSYRDSDWVYAQFLVMSGRFVRLE